MKKEVRGKSSAKPKNLAIFFKNNLDNLASAILLQHRLKNIMTFDEKKTILIPINYDSYTEYRDFEKFPFIKNDDYRIIFLGLSLDKYFEITNDFKKKIFFNCSYHSDNPHGLINLTFPSNSTIEIIDKTFPLKFKEENDENIKNLIKNIKTLNTCRTGSNFDEYKNSIVSFPGCLEYYAYHNRITVPKASNLLQKYMTGKFDKGDRSVVNDLISFNTKIINSFSLNNQVVQTKIKNKTVEIYHYSETQIDYLLAVYLHKAYALMDPNAPDITVLLYYNPKTPDKMIYSLKTKIQDFPFEKISSNSLHYNSRESTCLIPRASNNGKLYKQILDQIKSLI